MHLLCEHRACCTYHMIFTIRMRVCVCVLLCVSKHSVSISRFYSTVFVKTIAYAYLHYTCTVCLAEFMLFAIYAFENDFVVSQKSMYIMTPSIWLSTKSWWPFEYHNSHHILITISSRTKWKKRCYISQRHAIITVRSPYIQPENRNCVHVFVT